MVDKKLSAEQQLVEMLKRLEQNNVDNRKMYYAWLKKSSENFRDRLKKAVDGKLSSEEVDKIFDDAEQYNLEELVETKYDFVAMTKEELESLLVLLKKAFEDVEGCEPDEDEIYGFDYESIYEAWEDIQSTLEKKVEDINSILVVK